jgi:hypothetical protein
LKKLIEGRLKENFRTFQDWNDGVARELAPVRRRSRRKSGGKKYLNEPGCMFLGPLRSPAGASSLATRELR